MIVWRWRIRALFRSWRNKNDSLCAFRGGVLSQTDGIETARWNILHDKSPESGPSHRLAGGKGSLGNLDRLVENQGNPVLRHGRVKLPGDGADKGFFIHNFQSTIRHPKSRLGF